MTNLIDGRKFQLWEYKVSHGSVLIRSPSGPEISTNIDLVFRGVAFLSLPRHLGEIKFASPTELEMSYLVTTLGKEKLEGYKTWVLCSSISRFLVVGAYLEISENSADIFSSPL